MLLAIVLLSELYPESFNLFPRILVLNLISLVMFAGIGLWLPSPQSRFKFLYTAIEFSLVFFAAGVSGLRFFSLLYIVIVIRSSWMFQARSRAIITAAAFLGAVVFQSYRAQFLWHSNSDLTRLFIMLMFGGMLLLGLALLFLQLLVNAVLCEHRGREQLAIANAQLNQYALQVKDLAVLQERNHIAREIHDSLGHSLVTLKLYLEAAINLLQIDLIEANELLIVAKKLSADALEAARQSVTTLRSNPFQEKSLETMVQGLVEEFQQAAALGETTPFRAPQGELPSIASTVTAELHQPLPNAVKTAVYRIVQEALTNIRKHAHATSVEIAIWRQEYEIWVRIWDNGSGFERSQTTTGFGLQSMRERTLSLQGDLSIVTAPNQGCEIVANFPNDCYPRLGLNPESYDSPSTS
jgi:signal transduction histidine kinase